MAKKAVRHTTDFCPYCDSRSVRRFGGPWCPRCRLYLVEHMNPNGDRMIIAWVNKYAL